MEGETLRNRYMIKGVLGQGAFGTVYLAEDLQIPKVVWAIKEIWEDELEYEERLAAIKQFESEAKILKDLNHPGLPKIVDFFSVGPGHYLVMEYIEGKSLDDVHRERLGQMRQEDLFAWFIKICDILEYLHNQSPPVIFRDLKPSNIIITTGGRIKLVDFGIARFFDPEKANDTCKLGTPGFCAPEQYGIGQSDARTDVYSLGATLYYLLSGQDTAQFNFKFPPLTEFNPKVSLYLDDVLKRCLTPRPDMRYQSVGELREALIRAKSPPPVYQMAPSVSAGPGLFEKLLRNPIFQRSAAVIALAFIIGTVLLFVPSTYTIGRGMVIFSVLGLCIIGCGLFAYITYLVCCDIFQNRQVRIFLIALGILVVLLFLFFGATSFWGFQSARETSQYTTCQSNLRNMGTALEMYSTDNNGYYPVSLQKLSPLYLKTIPRCPKNQAVDYSYNASWDNTSFNVACTGKNHKGQQDPCYNSLSGLNSNY